MSQQWFCKLNGKMQGPFPLAVLREYEASGSVQHGTQVCEAGTEYWFEARKIKGLFPDELTWSEAESSEGELFPTAFPSPPTPPGMASSCPEQRPASLRMRPQTTASRARTQPANRIRHRRSLAEYAVLSLILFSVVGVLVYSVRQLHDRIARRLALLPVIAAIEATEQTQDDTDALEERRRRTCLQLLGPGKSDALTDWDFTDSRPNKAGNGVSAVESDSASMDAVTNIQESERVASTPRWQAPAIKLARLNGEDEFRLSDYRSEKVVLLDFWATWCGPCIQELPILTQIVSEYQDDEVALIAVNAQEKPSTIHQFLQTSGLDIEVALDEYGEAADAFGVEQLPTLVMIDKQGVVQRIHVGFDQRLVTIVKSELDSLVAGESLDLPHHMQHR